MLHHRDNRNYSTELLPLIVRQSPMDGALIIDKPAGMTSHDVVARVRRIIGERRVGHTGTLDPFATGVLVMLVGRATRLAQFLSGAEKEYEAVIRFGYATDTGDVTGARVDSSSAGARVISPLRMRRGGQGRGAATRNPTLNPSPLVGRETFRTLRKLKRRWLR